MVKKKLISSKFFMKPSSAWEWGIASLRCLRLSVNSNFLDTYIHSILCSSLASPIPDRNIHPIVCMPTCPSPTPTPACLSCKAKSRDSWGVNGAVTLYFSSTTKPRHACTSPSCVLRVLYILLALLQRIFHSLNYYKNIFSLTKK